MSRAIKLSFLFTGVGLILILFISSVTPKEAKPVDEAQLVESILKEYEREMMYGNPKVNIDTFVDQVLIETLKKNNQ